MGDVGDYWNEHKEWRRSVEGKQHHEKRRAKAIHTLKHCPGIKIVGRKNNDEHYILEVQGDRGPCTVDFWPSTLKWSKRKSKATGSGVRSLVSYFKLGEGK